MYCAGAREDAAAAPARARAAGQRQPRQGGARQGASARLGAGGCSGPPSTLTTTILRLLLLPLLYYCYYTTTTVTILLQLYYYHYTTTTKLLSRAIMFVAFGKLTVCHECVLWGRFWGGQSIPHTRFTPRELCEQYCFFYIHSFYCIT